jgi:hypothetical protein
VSTPRLAVARLAGADGGTLVVKVLSGAGPGESRPAVVVCRSTPDDPPDLSPFARLADRLAVAGFAVASFGFSGGATVDQADLATVVGHVLSHGASWLGLLGLGRSSSAVALYASGDPRVKALVTWAGARTPKAGGPRPSIPWLALEAGSGEGAESEGMIERAVAFFAAALP